MNDLTGQFVVPWPMCKLEPYDCEPTGWVDKVYRCAVCKVFVATFRRDDPPKRECGVPAIGQRWKVDDVEGNCTAHDGLVSGAGFVGGDTTFTLRMDDGSTKDFKWGEGIMA